MTENKTETKIETDAVKAAEEIKEDAAVTVSEESVKQELDKKLESPSSSSSSSSSDEKKSLVEVDPEDILPPPPQEDFPPPPAEMMTSVEDLPPPVFDLPSPTEDLPPAGTDDHKEDVGMSNGNKDDVPDAVEEAGKEAKSSYVTLVSPTGFKTFGEGESPSAE